MKSKFALAVLVAAVSGAAYAGQAEDAQVKWRQSAYSFTAWNCSKIKSQVIDHPETFNKEQIVAAANAIAAVANSGLGSLYGPGTEEATGWKKSRLKHDFFEKPEDAKKVAVAFVKEANELAKVVAGGDANAIKTQFGELGKTCKSCHDGFRVKD